MGVLCYIVVIQRHEEYIYIRTIYLVDQFNLHVINHYRKSKFSEFFCQGTTSTEMIDHYLYKKIINYL